MERRPSRSWSVTVTGADFSGLNNKDECVCVCRGGVNS